MPPRTDLLRGGREGGRRPFGVGPWVVIQCTLYLARFDTEAMPKDSRERITSFK